MTTIRADLHIIIENFPDVPIEVPQDVRISFSSDWNITDYNGKLVGAFVGDKEYYDEDYEDDGY